MEEKPKEVWKGSVREVRKKKNKKQKTVECNVRKVKGGGVRKGRVSRRAKMLHNPVRQGLNNFYPFVLLFLS